MRKRIEMERFGNVNVSRRKAIKQLSLIFAGTLTLTTIKISLAGHLQELDTKHRKSLTFNAYQLNFVKHLAEMIIPQTDTPGAITADVHGFMDYQIANCFTAKEKKQFITGLVAFDLSIKQVSGKLLLDNDSQTQIKLLTSVELQSMGFTEIDKQFFKQFKALTLLGYYTSEVGATQELNYLAILGGYKGSVSFASTGKAWAL